ncbi:MAG TPA: VWA domain-containing protein [Vicinamibacterales bacterium]|nr:VWA domain-containing protein [Vicinamibacterales bacterium]
MRPLLVAAAIGVLITPAGFAPRTRAQQPSPVQPGVTFRVEVNFVEIDAVVTDAQGNFVRGLSKDDFELIEDGAPQAISAFSAVDLPVRKADPPLFRTSTVEPDVQTNLEEFNGRVILILLDDLQTDFRRSARVRAAAREFVQRFVGANDLVAVLHTGSGARMGQEFTPSHGRLLAAIDKFSGRKIPSATLATLDDYYVQRNTGSGRAARDTMEGERALKARTSLSTLRAAAQFLGNVRGRRKAVVWFGEGIDYNIDNVFEATAAIEIQEEMRDAIAAATRAGVSFYGVDARGIGAGLDQALDIASLPDDESVDLGPSALLTEVRRAQDFLRSMSSQTGGFAVVNQNDLNAAFARIIQENSSYYLLGYYPSNDRRDGKSRAVEVRVKRPGLQVRSRRSYTAPRGKPPTATRASASTEAPPEIRAALDSPVPVSGLGMRVFAAAFAGPSKKSSVAAVIEFDPARLSFVQKEGVYSEELELVILPVDASGKALPGTRDQVPMRLSQRTFEAVRANGFRMTRRFDLAPGRYQLRVAARAANSRAVGGISYDLDVPDFTKPPLAISGIALMSAAGSRIPTPPPDKDFLEVLADAPTALREFAAGDTLSVFAEVYDNRAGTPHRVAITTTATADDGRVIFTAADERRSEEIQAKSGGFGHSIKVPLAGMAAGRYVLRVEARTLLSDGASASRELEFRVR